MSSGFICDWGYPKYTCIASSGVAEYFGMPVGWYVIKHEGGNFEPCENPFV